MCQVGHNITGGWAFTPCQCEGQEEKKIAYRKKRVPELLKLADELERRAGIWAHQSKAL